MKNWSKKLLLTALFAVFALIGQPTEIFAERFATLTPEKTLVIEFYVIPYTPQPPNTVTFAGGYVTILQPYNQITGKLYNGDTLLGTSTVLNRYHRGYTGAYSMHPMGPSFEAPGSPYDFPYVGEPATIDFSSVLNGTINGRIEATIDAGSIRMDLDKVYASLTLAEGPNYGQSIPGLRVTSVRMLPEEPGTPPPPAPPAPQPPTIDDDDITITPAQIKSSCEASRGNPVAINRSATLTSGSVVIASPCVLQLAPNVTLSSQNASLRFDGPLTIQSQGKAGLQMSKSVFSAPTMTVSLNGSGSFVKTNESSLTAASGALTVALGDESQLDVLKKHSSQANSLSGESVRVIGGGKFGVQLENARLTAASGFQLDMNGNEGKLASAGGTIVTAPSIRLNSTGAKSVIEAKDTTFRFASDYALRFTGAEAGVKLEKVTFGPQTGTAAGGATFEIGSNNNAYGAIEAKEIRIDRVGFVSVLVSPYNGGLLKFEKNYVKAAGDISFEAGGSVEIKENQLISGSRIGASNQASGSCSADSNSASAPIVRLCR